MTARILDKRELIISHEVDLNNITHIEVKASRSVVIPRRNNEKPMTALAVALADSGVISHQKVSGVKRKESRESELAWLKKFSPAQVRKLWNSDEWASMPYESQVEIAGARFGVRWLVCCQHHAIGVFGHGKNVHVKILGAKEFKIL